MNTKNLDSVAKGRVALNVRDAIEAQKAEYWRRKLARVAGEMVEGWLLTGCGQTLEEYIGVMGSGVHEDLDCHELCEEARRQLSPRIS